MTVLTIPLDTRVLAAAVLASATTLPSYWERDGADLILQVSQADGDKLLGLSISASDTVESLYRNVRNAQLTVGQPTSTVVLHYVDSPKVVHSLHDGALVLLLDRTRDRLISEPVSFFENPVLHRFQTVFSALQVPGSTLLHDIPVVSSDEHKLLSSWGSASSGDHCSDHEYSAVIHHYIERVVRETPDSLALQVENREYMTYGELNRRANLLAQFLVHDYGVGPGNMVLKFFDKCAELIVSQLAILKAGAAYVPLDIDHPPERTRIIQEMTQAAICLTTSSLAPIAAARLPTVTIISVDDFLASSSADLIRPQLSYTSRGEDLCYVMFTSGSTGVPKGVMVQHSSVVTSVINGPASNQRLRKQGSQLRTLLFSNYAFDYSVWDVFLTLTSGGCLCIAPKLTMLNDLTGIINSMSVTFLETTPTVLSLVELEKCPTLQTVYSSGEALTSAVQEKFMSHNATQRHVGKPEIFFGNGGAPTEATVMSVFGEVRPEDEFPVFGRPFGGNRIYILDARGELCPIGTMGQLWIGGPQVTKGYLGRDDLTAKVYRVDPFVLADASASPRMYNTGDLCSWLLDGRLIYYGRSDSQVKIRGQRVEISEIESVITRIPFVDSVCVIKSTYNNHEELVAFLVLKESRKDPLDLRQSLSSKLPSYMIPSEYITLSNLPTTSNGKVDRKVLESIAQESAARRRKSNTPSSPEVLPIADLPTETSGTPDPSDILKRAWSSALSIPPSSIDENTDFFALGGDSISAIRVSAVCRAAGYSLGIVDFQSHSTITQQCRLLEKRLTTRKSTPNYTPFEMMSPGLRSLVMIELATYGYRDVEIEDAYPSVSSVAGLVSLAVANPMSYFAQYAFKKSGVFDKDRLRKAWRLVASRHPILRTAFIVAPEPYNDVVEIVLNDSHYDLPWLYHHLEHDSEMHTAVERLTSTSIGFSLGRVPTSLALFESEKSSILVFQLHHAQFDGFSILTILRHLAEAYHACSSEPTLSWKGLSPIMPHFVKWIDSQERTKAIQYWKNRLDGAVLPSWPKSSQLDLSTKVITSSSVIHSFCVAQRLATFCADNRTTLSSFLCAAVAVTLGLHQNSDDVLFAFVTSGRSANVAGIEDIVGYCASTIPCRVRYTRDSSFNSIVKTVHNDFLASSSHQFLGLNEIINGAFPVPYDILKVILTVENLPGLSQANKHDEFLGDNLHGLTVEVTYPFAITVFPSLDGPKQGLEFHFGWDPRVLSERDVDWFKNHLFSVLDATLNHPTSPLDLPSFMTAQESTYVRHIGVGTGSNPSPYSFFHHSVDDIATNNTRHIAIQHVDGAAVTYEELVCKANQVAHSLQTKGVAPESMVPVFFDQNQNSIEVIIAFLAILKAGGAFVPLNCAWPQALLEACIHQTRSTFAICDSQASDRLANTLSSEVYCISELATGQISSAPSTPDLRPNSLGYVTFMRDSDNEAIGVMVEHGNIISYIDNALTVFPLREASNMLHCSPWSSVEALGDLFLSLSQGKTLLLANIENIFSDISGLLNRSKADYVTMPPAIAQQVQLDIDHPYLKTVIVAGDKLPRLISERWRNKVRLINAYGFTESPVLCISKNHSTVIPPHPDVLGRPIGSMKAYIVDSDMRPVPMGALGELCIAGAQVARGYLNSPDETNSVFLPDPFCAPIQEPDLSNQGRMFKTGELARWNSDGTIEYLGRNASRFAINLHDVEAMLTMGTGRDVVACVEQVELDGASHLAAFISSTIGRPGSPICIRDDVSSYEDLVKALRQSCQRMLPSHAIPSLWLILQTIPLNDAYKIDRKRLLGYFKSLASEPGRRIQEMTRMVLSGYSGRGPKTPVEQMLHDMWLVFLGREDDISVHDDFFNLGGDSIRCIKLLAALKRKGCDVTVTEFYQARTIERLADIIQDRFPSFTPLETSTSDASLQNGLIVQIRQAKSDTERRNGPMWFVHDGKGLIGPQYGELGTLDRDVYGISNPALDEQELSQSFPSWHSFVECYIPLMPSTSVFIAGWSSGGNIALLLAAERVRRGLPVKGVILLDSYNGQGFIPKRHKTDYDDPAKRRAYSQMNHIETLLPHFEEPVLENVPVLLIRADQDPLGRIPASYPGKRKEDICVNFWSRDKLKRLDIALVEGANHKTMMDEASFRPRVATIMRHWCSEWDDN
ncbi:hypothetical protein VKT23_001332 [Stygiomarasmius scandens]|uniref:Carrier domain-containing protein n=1 Tax=Marasmiellus scandens TaxID=2682957 RepID=A0ABR1K734_9AGAR